MKAKVLGGLIPAKLMYYWILLNLLNAFGLEKCLRKASFYKSFEKLSDMRLNLIGDTCHEMSGGTLRLFSPRLFSPRQIWHMWLAFTCFYFFVLVTTIVGDTL